MEQIDEVFKQKNIRNLNESDLNKPIYRIISMDRLVDMFEHNHNTLVKVNLWEDPYENFFYKADFRLGTDRISASDIADQTYGQCWSQFKNSDALWRIYSKNKDCVRIKTTIRKLYDSIYISDYCLANTFIGGVKYKAKKDIEQWINNMPITSGNINQTGIESLYIKRNNFAHEKEIRAIVMNDSHDKTNSSDIKSFSIDPNTFIDQIAFDPRIAYTDFKKQKNDLCDKIDYPKSKIVRSDLYLFKPQIITLE